MAGYHWIPAAYGGIGTLPCGEDRWFQTQDAYSKAYRAEEDEIADELARLEMERELEFPEDYNWLVA